MSEAARDTIHGALIAEYCSSEEADRLLDELVAEQTAALTSLVAHLYQHNEEACRYRSCLCGYAARYAAPEAAP